MTPESETRCPQISPDPSEDEPECKDKFFTREVVSAGRSCKLYAIYTSYPRFADKPKLGHNGSLAHYNAVDNACDLIAISV